MVPLRVLLSISPKFPPHLVTSWLDRAAALLGRVQTKSMNESSTARLHPGPSSSSILSCCATSCPFPFRDLDSTFIDIIRPYLGWAVIRFWAFASFSSLRTWFPDMH